MASSGLMSLVVGSTAACLSSFISFHSAKKRDNTFCQDELRREGWSALNRLLCSLRFFLLFWTLHFWFGGCNRFELWIFCLRQVRRHRDSFFRGLVASKSNFQIQSTG